MRGPTKAASAGALIAALGLAVGVFFVWHRPGGTRQASATPGGHNFAVPPLVDVSRCSDERALVELFVARQESGVRTIRLPPRQCWNIGTPLRLRGRSNVTIDGDGDTIAQPVAGPAWSPMLALFQDTDLTIDGLDFQGPNTGQSRVVRGPYSEGRLGIVMEADSHVVLDHVDMVGIGGDFVELMPPGVHEGRTEGLPNGANHDISVLDCDWVRSGYHGITIEAAVGVDFSHDTIAGAPTDAIDMEYDGAYLDGPDGPGWPQNEVTFEADTFAADGDVVLNVSNTGKTSVNGLVFDDNKLIDGTRAIFDIAGVSGGAPVSGVVIASNRATSPTGGPDPNDTIDLVRVHGATIQANRFPWGWYVQPAHTAHLSKVAVSSQSSSGVRVEDNVFIGARAPAIGTVVTSCGNVYLVDAWQDRRLVQAACG